MSSNTTTEDAELESLTDQLLKRDRETHQRALETLAEVGDERIVPHLVDIAMIDAVANEWDRFGFPEVLRDDPPPRYLALPEVEWPGVIETLCAVADPDFDSAVAWLQWETWYSQQDIEPLVGYDEWKLRLARSYLPLQGPLLESTPRDFALRDIRLGNTDRSRLAALNFPEFVPGEAVSADASTEGLESYLNDDETVFGFEVGGQPYAVPRMLLFPHEILNADLQGVPVSLAWCSLCNAPLLYDRRVEGRPLTFGNTGMLLRGNKVMYDEETQGLWAHHVGEPIAGEFLTRDVSLDPLAVSMTEWADWREANPDTLVPRFETGFDYDYRFYEGNIGVFRHYWESDDHVPVGLRTTETERPRNEAVYGVESTDGSTVHLYPLEAVSRGEPIVDEFDGRSVVVVGDVDGADVAVYEAPPRPIERDGEVVVDGDGNRWTLTKDGLVAGNRSLDRVVGRHGLLFAFVASYEDYEVVAEA